MRFIDFKILKGALSEGGSLPANLYNVQLNIYASSYCANTVAVEGFIANWNSQICAGVYTGGKDTCQGMLYFFKQNDKFLFFD